MTFLEESSAAKMSIDYYWEVLVGEELWDGGRSRGVGHGGNDAFLAFTETLKSYIHLLLLDSLWHEIVSKALFGIEKDPCCTLSKVQNH